METKGFAKLRCTARNPKSLLCPARLLAVNFTPLSFGARQIMARIKERGCKNLNPNIWSGVCPKNGKVRSKKLARSSTLFGKVKTKIIARS